MRVRVYARVYAYDFHIIFLLKNNFIYKFVIFNLLCSINCSINFYENLINFIFFVKSY